MYIYDQKDQSDRMSIRITIKDMDLHRKVKIYAAEHNMNRYEAYEKLVKIGLEEEKKEMGDKND